MNRYRIHALAIASIVVGLLLAAPAWAGYAKVDQATWQQGVTGLPTYVNMYAYVPSTVASKPAVAVYCHHCQGNAASSHQSMAGLESLADKNGFIIIYPEATGENCWDAGSKRSLKHGGGGDTGAVVQMVKYVISKYNGDADRVYVAGDSSGGIMTEALLGVYPDVFMAGVSIMGVPCGCWGQSDYNDTTGTGSTAQWCGSCAGGNVTMTGAQWGDLVRSYFPGYTGHRPRLQHWHGASDTTLNYKNVAEDIKEWTNLLGLSETPTATEQNTPKSGTTHQYWKNSCYTVYETFVLANTAHAVSLDGATLAAYFGIDKTSSQDPETAACPGAVPGGGGTGGAGGSTGTGGATGSGGATGGAMDGGPGGRDGGGDAGVAGSGGAIGTGGSSSSGGAIGTGGAIGSGGATGTGGRSGSAGATTTGGRTGAAGATETGGAAGGNPGGSTASGGTTASPGGSSASTSASSGGSIAGSAGQSPAGATAGGGATGQAGNTGNSSSSGAGGGSSGGCGCAVGGHATRFAALWLAIIGLVCRRQRRPRA